MSEIPIVLRHVYVAILLLLNITHGQLITGINNYGAPYDLKVNIFEDTSYNVNIHDHGALKLNITWSSPVSLWQPISYR